LHPFVYNIDQKLAIDPPYTKGDAASDMMTTTEYTKFLTFHDNMNIKTCVEKRLFLVNYFN